MNQQGWLLLAFFTHHEARFALKAAKAELNERLRGFIFATRMKP